MPELTSWIGREERVEDMVTEGPLTALAALLDHAAPPWPQGCLPPLGHWLYCLNRVAQSQLGPDGHEKRGEFIPPITLPRRMWAGGKLIFHHPIRLGAFIRRVSTIAGVSEKQGKTGQLVFVKVKHRIEDDKGLALEEEQDIVYREAAPQGGEQAGAGEAPPAEFDWQRTVTPDPVSLFRYSALTFNGHRIHYDREFCKEHEGYPGLVYHGPLTATVLVDLFLRNNPGQQVMGFSFRALAPLFDTKPFSIHGKATKQGTDLWAVTPEGRMAMKAELQVG